MQEYIKRGGTKLNIEKLRYDKNSQDFILMKGMPSIARRNKNEFNIFNNERFICEFIRKDKIIIKNDNGDKIDINLKKLINYSILVFVLLHTELKVKQLIQIIRYTNGKKMNTKLRYVALSRSTDKNILI